MKESRTRRYGACTTASEKSASGSRAAGHLLVAVPLDVRVVQAGEGQLDRPSSFSVPRVLVRFSQPAASKRVPQVLPRVVDGADHRLVAVQAVAALGLLQQVAGGVAQLRAVVVVRAEDVHARELHQRAERVQHLGDALGVGEVVAGVDHEVRAQPGQGLQPARFLRWPPTMWMSETWSTRSGRIPAGQDRHRHPAQAEGAGLEAGGVGQTGGADRRDSGGPFRGTP